MTGELASAYTSGAQRARVVTEAWGAENLYCPNCSSLVLTRKRNNTKAIDFECPGCGFKYQLKGQKSPIRSSVVDGEYKTMMKAIRSDVTPNFYFMHYELATWRVKNLLLVPSFAFPASAIIERNPTTPKGRNHPWIGCNIALHRIPLEARIAVVTDNQAASANEVRDKFKKAKRFKEFSVEKRGWMLDVLSVVRRLERNEFTNQHIYAFEQHFKELHPNNNFIRDKIRQQLQDLAKAGFLVHAGRNDYRLK